MDYTGIPVGVLGGGEGVKFHEPSTITSSIITGKVCIRA